MRKVMVFGTFDGVHEGHRHFLKEAKELGDYLIVVVAPDEVVRDIKGKTSVNTLAERVAHVEAEDDVDKTVVGDIEKGSWDIVKELHPDIIAVGYDQKEMKKSLENSIEDFNWFIEIETISPHEPEKYHSSIINNRKFLK